MKKKNIIILWEADQQVTSSKTKTLFLHQIRQTGYQLLFFFYFFF